jgi:predicted transposase YdaD
VLTIIDAAEAPAAARFLLEKTEQEELTEQERANLIDTVTSIMVYKFANLGRVEIRAMLGLDLTEEPRAIREAREEGREEGWEEGREEGERSLLFRLLNKKVGELPEAVQDRISTLSFDRLESLGEALLDFTSVSDLERWLAAQE